LDREEVLLSVVLIAAVLAWIASIVLWSMPLALVAGVLALGVMTYILWDMGRV